MGSDTDDKVSRFVKEKKKMKKQTISSEMHAKCSNCFKCAWRWPTNSENPRMCLLGVRDQYHGEPLIERPYCDRFIRDDFLQIHLSKMLHLDDKFKDEILSNFIPLDEVTIKIPKTEVGDIVDYMINSGKSQNYIRMCFGLKGV